MHDVDALGRDQVLQDAGVLAQAEQVDPGVDELDPFAAGGLELADQRAVRGRDQRAGARLQQRECDIEGGARVRLVIQGRDDLQYGGAGERAPRNARPLIAIAHGGAFIDALAFAAHVRDTAARR